MPPRNRKTEAEAVAPEPDENEEKVAPIAPEPDTEPEEDPGETEGGFTLLNPGTTSVVYTDDGKMIGAGERLPVDSVDGTGQIALDRGYLNKID